MIVKAPSITQQLLCLLVLAGSLLSLAAQAKASPSLNETVTQASLKLEGEQTGRYAALLEHTDIQLDISGMLVRTRVRQRFSNPGSEWAEGVYTYPLPEDSAVDRLRMRIGERVIEGEIQERNQARQTYRKAKQQGQRTGLVEQQRPNIFTTSVANIGPGEQVVIEIEYQQRVLYDSGQFRLRVPLVVFPRYIPGKPLALPPLPQLEIQSDSTQPSHQPPRPQTLHLTGTGWAQPTDQVEDADLITPPVAHSPDEIRNRVSIQAELKAGFELQQLASSYHPVSIKRPSDSHAKINLRDGHIRADRDFELVWTPKPSQLPQAALLSHQIGEHHYGLLMLLPPTTQTADTRLPRSTTLVLDISGSMHGPSLHQAKTSLVQAINRLEPQDRFNLIVFNNRSHSLYPQPQPADAAHRQEALAFVQGLSANGGTEMAGAIELALAQPPQEGYVEQVLFITDGAIGNETALFSLIEQQLGKRRFYTVGIGSAPNSHFMRKAAQLGRGSFTLIGHAQEVRQKMGLLLDKIDAPQLIDIQLDSPLELQHYPEAIPDLYRGEPLLLSFRADQLPDQLTVSGRLLQQTWQQQLELQAGKPNPAVATLWGRDRIEALMDRYRNTSTEARDQVRQQIIDNRAGPSTGIEIHQPGGGRSHPGTSRNRAASFASRTNRATPRRQSTEDFWNSTNCNASHAAPAARRTALVRCSTAMVV